MAVRVPAARAQIHFHIAGTRCVVADLNHRATKVRSAFGTGEAGMENTDGLFIGGHEPVAAQALVLPDGLQQAFGRRIIFIAQDICRAATQAPVGVKIFGQREHSPLLLRPRFSKVKPLRKIFECIQRQFCLFINNVADFLLAGAGIF